MSLGVVIIVLAAGLGSRFQDAGHKLIQPLGDTTVLGATLAHAVDSELSVVVVTTRALAAEAVRHVPSGDVVVLDEAHSEPAAGGASADLRAAHARFGMGASIAAGVSARSGASGWLVMPGDMPLLRPSTLQRVAQALATHPVAYAQHQGRRGHPVGFSAELYSELITLRGDVGARRLVSRYPSQAVEVDDPGTLVDIDTVNDLLRVRALWDRSVRLTT